MNNWYGQYPSHWKLERLQNHLIEINESNNPVKSDNILSLTNKLGVVPYSEKGNQGNVAKENLEGYKLAYPDTIVCNCMNVLIGSVGISKYYGCVSPVYYVYKAKDNADLEFINYVFQTVPFQKELRRYANGILEIRLRVSSSNILKREIPIPSKDEQVRIVKAIKDNEEKINDLIANEEKQIEKLKAYKQALISEVVTKGLDHNVPMKDSGVEWIGEIPANWSVIRIKNASWLKGRIGWDGLKSTEFIEEGPYLITGTDFINGKINWSTCVHITDERFEEDMLLHVFEGDLLITKDGTVGKLAIVKNAPEKVSLNSGVMIIRNIDTTKYTTKWLYYILSSNQFDLWYQLSQRGNSTIKHLYQAQFYNFAYALPSIEIQKKICDKLDYDCEIIHQLTDSHLAKIEYLKQYRQSIIYEYVTGKREI